MNWTLYTHTAYYHFFLYYNYLQEKQFSVLQNMYFLSPLFYRINELEQLAQSNVVINKCYFSILCKILLDLNNTPKFTTDGTWSVKSRTDFEIYRLNGDTFYSALLNRDNYWKQLYNSLKGSVSWVMLNRRDIISLLFVNFRFNFHRT